MLTNTALTPEQLELAYQNKWFRLFVRKEFGGAELLLPEALIELAAASRVDGSLGWCVNLGSGASYFSGFLRTDVAMRLLSDATSAFAGSGQIGSAKTTDQGFEISGFWQRCTGSAHATTFTVNAENEVGEIHSYCLDPKDVELTDEWTMMGVQASSTYAIRANAAFVPKDQRFLIGSPIVDSSYAIHTIPFEPFARACMMASLIGMAQCFIDRVEESEVIIQRPNILELCVELRVVLDESFQALLEEARIIQNKPDHSDTDLKNLVVHSAANIRMKVMQIVDAAGLQLVDLAQPANRAFRDLLVAGQHNLFR